MNLLDRNRYDIHLACGPAELDASHVAVDVQVHVVSALVRPVKPVRDLQAAWALHDLIKRQRYDIVHTHNSKAGVLGRIAARLAGVPVIVHTAHTISFAASESRVANWLYRVADRACAHLSKKIITVSSVNTTTYLDAHVGSPGQYVTIYSGVEISKYEDRSERDLCRAELGIQGHDLLVVWIGRLNRQKDPVTFVRAAELLSRQLPRAHFLMVGEDPLGESLEGEVRSAIQEAGLEAVVRLIGYRSDVHRILAAADLVMHTSRYEGLGRSVIEAMLACVPLVATAVDGVREAIVSGERGGLLVQPDNPAALANAALELVQNPHFAARIASAGQAWAKRRFDVRDMVTAIDRLYQQLLRDLPRGSRDQTT